MATQTYRVTFRTAYKVPGIGGNFDGILMPNLFAGPTDVFDFTADNAKEVRARVDALGERLGKSVTAYVRCYGARKPAGFDKLTRGLYYNLTEEPKTVPA